MFNFWVQHSPIFYLIQSIWRDEAFSILLSERSPLWFVSKNFDPPLYYILLHFWMKLFGESELATRSLSIVGFSLATIVVIYWAEKLFKKHWLSWYLPIFFFFNPMLLYYAFEIRAYAWYVLFTVLSFMTYLEEKWILNAVFIVLGLYTHSYMIIVPVTETVHYILTHWKQFNIRKPATILNNLFLRSMAVSLLLFSPWLYHFVMSSNQLKNAWYFPVDFHLIRSVLGNLFLGYEGTPGFIWDYSTVLSLILLIAFAFALKDKRDRTVKSFFCLMVFFPLIVVIGISFWKPLFVNRYVIPVSIAEVLLLALALRDIKNPILQKGLAVIALLFVVGFNMWYPTKHAKVNIRSTVLQVNALMTKQDVILVDSPLVLFETIYYSSDRSRVFLYNPERYPFPWYVGGIIVKPNQIVYDYPPYPMRAFIIKSDGSYDMRYSTDALAQPKPAKK